MLVNPTIPANWPGQAFESKWLGSGWAWHTLHAETYVSEATSQSGAISGTKLSAAAQSFTAPATAWPADRWWTSYGDAQLDGLIDEALKDSPDLAKAQARVRRAEAYAQVTRSTLGPQVVAEATVAELKGRGVEFDGPVEDRGFGLVTSFTMPGHVTVELYQPRYTK